MLGGGGVFDYARVMDDENFIDREAREAREAAPYSPISARGVERVCIAALAEDDFAGWQVWEPATP